jgi:hypothetical protein
MSLSLRRIPSILLCSLSLEAPGNLRLESSLAARVLDVLLTRGGASFIYRF